MNFHKKFNDELIFQINKVVNQKDILSIVKLLSKIRKQKGRLFILGVGGSAANASHAVNDFRKIANIEAYSPSDNVSELTARTNDDGWEQVFFKWLKISKINQKDCLLIFSVGGGNQKKKVSINLINAIKLAKKSGTKTIAVVGKKDGYAAKNCDKKIIFRIKNKEFITPISETLQAYVWHLIVSHPILKKNKTKW